MRILSLPAALLLSVGGLLASCVTINIYFPAAAAEKAADKIIEEVWQLKKSEESKALPNSAAPVTQPKP